MASVWGDNIKISIFGESHGKGIGVVIDGIPAGEKINLEEINFQMKRRNPKNYEFTTSRNETDVPEIVSGIFNRFTTGTPICAIIYNKDIISKNYEENQFLLRPGHSDYTSYIKYKGFQDFRGGGHFSGRLTASLVFSGNICKQILKKKGITIGAHISSIGDINDELFDPINIKSELLDYLSLKKFPVIKKDIKLKMKNKILEIKSENDSIGGIIECAIVGLSSGFGNPIFDNIESKISSIIFSIPAVKGIEFGNGFNSSKIKGSENNDEFILKNGKIKTKTNNSGGILGGISSGMPIIFKTAFKPTPSIKKNQNTVNIKTFTECQISTNGRHDPCIAVRAVSVIESVVAIAILDLISS